MIPKYNTDKYWKTAKEYLFTGSGDGDLNLYAHSPRIAMLKKTNHNKWIEKRGFEKANYKELYEVIYVNDKKILHLVRKLK